MACRDCPECCESDFESLWRFPGRLIYELLTAWNVGLFVKKCPQCGHRLDLHKAQDDFDKKS